MSYKSCIAILALMFVVSTGQAQQGTIVQSDIDSAELQAEIYEETNRPQQVIDSDSRAESSQNQKVLILNSQPHSQEVIQQPTTQVIASPLADSRAEQIRRIRRDAEVQTEEKIVEKLEASRLDDEKRRAERLFGDRFESNAQTGQQANQNQVGYVQDGNLQQNQVTVQKTKVVQVQKDEEDYADEDYSSIKEEIAQSIKLELESEKEARKSIGRAFYLSAGVGMTEYMDVSNIDSDYAAGFSLGADLEGGLSVDASFVYSEHIIKSEYWDTPWPVYEQMDQYNFALAAKYNILKGIFRPQVGGVASYTYRNYSDRTLENHEAGIAYEDASTHSFDLGLTVGAEFLVSDSFALGVDYRYMFNLTNRNDSEYLSAYRDEEVGKPVEDLNYSTFLINGKVRF